MVLIINNKVKLIQIHYNLDFQVHKSVQRATDLNLQLREAISSSYEVSVATHKQILKNFIKFMFKNLRSCLVVL